MPNDFEVPSDLDIVRGMLKEAKMELVKLEIMDKWLARGELSGNSEASKLREVNKAQIASRKLFIEFLEDQENIICLKKVL